jgi:hypothetical protein
MKSRRWTRTSDVRRLRDDPDAHRAISMRHPSSAPGPRSLLASKRLASRARTLQDARSRVGRRSVDKATGAPELSVASCNDVINPMRSGAGGDGGRSPVQGVKSLWANRLSRWRWGGVGAFGGTGIVRLLRARRARVFSGKGSGSRLVALESLPMVDLACWTRCALSGKASMAANSGPAADSPGGLVVGTESPIPRTTVWPRGHNAACHGRRARPLFAVETDRTTALVAGKRSC